MQSIEASPFAGRLFDCNLTIVRSGGLLSVASKVSAKNVPLARFLNATTVLEEIIILQSIEASPFAG
ncbi:MAG: hypothetical protein J5757_04600, partial [Lachnospiraceae bacterium]|nr:hypothetical protein [Lachnospiraceae bacterium]